MEALRNRLARSRREMAALLWAISGGIRAARALCSAYNRRDHIRGLLRCRRNVLRLTWQHQ